MAKKSNQPSDMANDIAGLVFEGTKKWTKIKKTEERNHRFAALSSRADDASKGHLAKRRGGTDSARGLQQGLWWRRASRECAPAHVRRTPPHPKGDGPGSERQTTSRKPCCPTIW